MDNRSEFLNNVAQALGRPLRLEPQAEDAPLNNYANERLTQLTQQQRCDAFIQLKWFTEFGHLNRGDMLTSEQHRCHNEKKKFQRRV